jgi:neurofibromin 1
MSGLLNDAYIRDQSAQRRALESKSSITMICNVLNFLSESPMTLFEGPPDGVSDRDRFYFENFESFVSCMIAADESVRQLALGVAKPLLANNLMITTLRASGHLNSREFKINFWNLSYVVGPVTTGSSC